MCMPYHINALLWLTLLQSYELKYGPIVNEILENGSPLKILFSHTTGECSALVNERETKLNEQVR